MTALTDAMMDSRVLMALVLVLVYGSGFAYVWRMTKGHLDDQKKK